jgi:hypothetical protein
MQKVKSHNRAYATSSIDPTSTSSGKLSVTDFRLGALTNVSHFII